MLNALKTFRSHAAMKSGKIYDALASRVMVKKLNIELSQPPLECTIMISQIKANFACSIYRQLTLLPQSHRTFDRLSLHGIVDCVSITS